MTEAEQKALTALLEDLGQRFSSRDGVSSEVRRRARDLAFERTAPEAIEAAKRAHFRLWSAERDIAEMARNRAISPLVLDGQGGLIEQWQTEWEATKP